MKIYKKQKHLYNSGFRPNFYFHHNSKIIIIETSYSLNDYVTVLYIDSNNIDIIF
jgi:hypothetical protein